MDNYNHYIGISILFLGVTGVFGIAGAMIPMWIAWGVGVFFFWMGAN